MSKLRTLPLLFVLALGCGKGWESEPEDSEPEPLEERDASRAPVPSPLDSGTRLDGALAVRTDAGRVDPGPGPTLPCTTCGDGGTPAPLPAPDACDALMRRAGVLAEGKPYFSFARMLCETANLDRFTRPPAHNYRAKLASSYDRTSVLEGVPGWFGNNDASGYIRDEGDEHVMMEAKEPGVITRIWSPNPSGYIRIYIDDPRKPAIELPMVDFFAGKFTAPWGPPFVFTAAQGHSAYFPIPYSRYARVTTTTSAPLYYQVNYREYPPSTEVQPYSPAAMAELVPLAAEVAKLLNEPGGVVDYAALTTKELSVTAAQPEASLALGPAVIREFSVRGFDPSEAALRGTRILVRVDDELTIDAPLGDLFGAGPGVRVHKSIASAMTETVFSLHWPMPVKGKIAIRAEINGVALANLTFRLRYSQGVPEDYRLFHAKWTGPKNFNTESPLDWTVLQYRGGGWYVGTSLNVTNPTAWWWGEGDDKMFVDGESFPSNFGTGTEDYFGFGWCSNELFAKPWIGQTRADGPLNQGRSSQYRWHVGDAIPFNTELRVSFEVLHWISGLLSVSLTEDAVAYWYADPQGETIDTPVPTTDFEVPPFTPLDSWLPGGTYNCRM